MRDSSQLRNRLNEVLRTDADLDAFCLDFFRKVHGRFTKGMDRLQKVNLLLELVSGSAEILASLEKYEARDSRSPTPTSPHVSIGRLPTSLPTLIGRAEELEQLDASWNVRPRRRVVAIVAMGGQGKTTLAVNWLLNMSRSNYNGARQVFGWSFYSQGASDDRAVSADEFIAAALKFFGDHDPAQGTPFDKADRLVSLVRKETSLLVLDGLEALQHPPGGFQDEGTIKDKALASLLRDLSLDNPGLVLITSRTKLADLEVFEGESVHTIALGPFSESEGTALLRSLHVHGPDAELAAAVCDFKGHPLALTLLGNLLREGFGGDVHKRTEVGPLQFDDAKGGQARRALAAYERWFGPSPQRALLRLLGLFDRPAPDEALQVLRAEPAVPGLNDAVVTLTASQWSQVVERLRRAGLVEARNPAAPGHVDAHPLTREYFGELLKQENEETWREGHARLYAWYSATAKHQPDTLEEMAPLYAAVWHGCRAGRHQESFDTVFWWRIRRFNEAYSLKRLGTFGADLSALSNFFTAPWTRPVPGLRERDCAFVLNDAGYTLRALGRLEEAVEPLRAALDAHQARHDYKNASIAAENLSELQLALGRLKEAAASARQAVELADQSSDAFDRITSRTTLANVLHQSRQTEESLRLFVQAEEIQGQHEPERPILYSLQGYQYCDLLLDRGAIDEVRRRAEQSIEVARRSHRPLDIGLDHLSLGRAHTACLEADSGAQAAQAREHLNQAVSSMREAGYQDYLTHALLHRAAFFRQRSEFASAGRDLEESLLLAVRGHMRLSEADIHLELARLFQAGQHVPEAYTELAQARSLIGQTGYARRTAAAELLARQLGERDQRSGTVS